MKEYNNFIITYLNFSYVLCLSPFRLARKSKSLSQPKFSIRTNIFQKTLCFITTFLGSFWIVRDLRVSFQSNDELKNPSLYFRTMFSILSAAMKIVTVFSLWGKSQDYLSLVEFLGNQPYFTAPRALKSQSLQLQKHRQVAWFIRKPAVVIICVTYLVIVASSCTFGLGLGASTEQVLRDWKKYIVHGMKYCLLLEQHQFSRGSFPETIFFVCGAIGYLQRRLLGVFCDLLVLMCTLTLWSSSNTFSRLLRKGAEDEFDYRTDEYMVSFLNPHKWTQVLRDYATLKTLAGLLNKVFGNHLSCFVLGFSLYYATRFDEMFVKREGSSLGQYDSPKMITSMAYFLVNPCAVLYFSADICYQVTYETL